MTNDLYSFTWFLKKVFMIMESHHTHVLFLQVYDDLYIEYEFS